jgi:hypothetical protein
MTETKIRVDAAAGFAAPPFHPILTDAGGAHLHDARDHNAFDRHRRRYWRTV